MISTTGDDVIRLVFPTPDETDTRVDLGTNPFTTYAVATKTPHSRLVLNFLLKFFIFYFSVYLSLIFFFLSNKKSKSLIMNLFFSIFLRLIYLETTVDFCHVRSDLVLNSQDTLFFFFFCLFVELLFTGRIYFVMAHDVFNRSADCVFYDRAVIRLMHDVWSCVGLLSARALTDSGGSKIKF
jgi:hypothetical protein